MSKWFDIPDFPGYQINRNGDVKSFLRKYPHILHGAIKSKRYKFVALRKNNETVVICIHELVARTFLGIKPEGYHVHHINNIASDNRPENLCYLSPENHRKCHSYAEIERGAYDLGKDWNYMNVALPYNEELRGDLRALAAMTGRKLGDLVHEAVINYFKSELETIRKTKKSVQADAQIQQERTRNDGQ